jgi:hypothetical protein
MSPTCTASWTYHDALVASGIETTLVIDPAATHEWLGISPQRITDGFSTH